MSSRLCLLVAALAVSCVKPPPKKVEAKPASPERAVQELFREAYAALERGEPEGWGRLLAADVHAFGLGPKDALSGRECIDEIRQQLIPIGLSGAAFKVVSSSPKVGVAPGGKSAWAWDFPTVELGGDRPTRWMPRVTLHAFDADDRWLVDAVHVSLGFPNDELYQPAVAARLPAAVELAQNVEPAAKPLHELLELFLERARTKVDKTSDGDAVVLIGTDAAEVFQGGRAFKEWARPQLGQLDRSAFTLRTEGGVLGRVAPGGETGWVAANIVLTLGSGKRAVSLPPFRGLFVFAKEGEAWSLVQDHQSLGVPVGMRRPEPPPKPDAGED